MRKAWRVQIVRMKYGPLFRIRRVNYSDHKTPAEAYFTKQRGAKCKEEKHDNTENARDVISPD